MPYSGDLYLVSMTQLFYTLRYDTYIRLGIRSVHPAAERYRIIVQRVKLLGILT